MVRSSYILGLILFLVASGILGFCVQRWFEENHSQGTSWDSPGAVQMLRANGGGLKKNGAETTPPLVKQAEALAAYLAPAPPTKLVETPVAAQEAVAPIPAIRPPAPTAKFKLVATSYYPNQPKRSMALISEVGSLEASERWVKEGTQVEHFIIQEIRHGLIIYRDGDNLREMAVEAGIGSPSLVQDPRPGSRRVTAAVKGPGATTPVPAGPNSIEIIGGN